MHSAAHTPRDPSPVAADDLARLLELEQVLASRLEHARAEAVAIVEAAKATATALENASADTIHARLRELESRHGVAVGADQARTREASRRAMAGFEQVTDDEVRTLASNVVARVLTPPVTPR